VAEVEESYTGQLLRKALGMREENYVAGGKTA